MANRLKANAYSRILADAKALYGVVLTELTYANLCACIRNGQGKCLGKESSRVTIWQVDIAGKPLVVLYNKRNGRIVKVMANPDMQKLAS